MLYINNKMIELKKFSDGTIAIDNVLKDDYTKITWKYDGDEELFQLYCLTYYLKDNGIKHIELNMPYIPNARMDKTKSNSLPTLKYFSDFINKLQFDKVYVFDPHSDASINLINNIIVKTPEEYIAKIFKHIKIDNLILFFPDVGAMNRYSEIIKKYNIPYIFGIKKRDNNTGRITQLTISNDKNIELKNMDVLIIDDILSSGETIKYSINLLKEYKVNKIYVFVSHCENTIKENPLLKNRIIDKLFTTDSIFREKISSVIVLNK